MQLRCNTLTFFFLYRQVALQQFLLMVEFRSLGFHTLRQNAALGSVGIRNHYKSQCHHDQDTGTGEEDDFRGLKMAFHKAIKIMI